MPSLDMPPLSLSPFVQPVDHPAIAGVADAKGNLLGRPPPEHCKVVTGRVAGRGRNQPADAGQTESQTGEAEPPHHAWV